MVYPGIIETIFKKLELLRTFWKQLRTLIDAFERYLKPWFESWNCLERFENKEVNWCTRTLYEECGWRRSGEILNVEICSSLK